MKGTSLWLNELLYVLATSSELTYDRLHSLRRNSQVLTDFLVTSLYLYEVRSGAISTCYNSNSIELVIPPIPLLCQIYMIQHTALLILAPMTYLHLILISLLELFYSQIPILS